MFYLFQEFYSEALEDFEFWLSRDQCHKTILLKLMAPHPNTCQMLIRESVLNEFGPKDLTS